MALLRQIRAALVISAAWLVLWFLPGLSLGIIRYWREGLMDFDVPVRSSGMGLDWTDHFWAHVGSFLGVWSLGAALGGLFFAIILGLAERGRSLQDLSRGRLMLWGGLGAALFPVAILTADGVAYGFNDLWVEFAVIVGVAAVLGVGSAAATLRLAGIAPRKSVVSPGAA